MQTYRMTSKRLKPEKQAPSKFPKRCVACEQNVKLPQSPAKDLEYEIIKEENKIQQKEIEKYQDELRQLISEKNTLLVTNNELLKQYKEKTEVDDVIFQELENRITHMQQDFKHKVAELSLLEKAHNQAKSELEEKEKELAGYHSSLVVLKHEFEGIVSQVKAKEEYALKVSADLSERIAKNKDLNQCCDKLEKELEGERVTSKKMKLERDDFEQKYDKVLKEKDEMAKLVEDLQIQNNFLIAKHVKKPVQMTQRILIDKVKDKENVLHHEIAKKQSKMMVKQMHFAKAGPFEARNPLRPSKLANL